MRSPFRLRVALLLLAAGAALGRRTRPASAPSPVQEQEVHLIVQRHGLSCTNAVEKWLSYWDFGRANIHDPVLTGAGKAASIEASWAVSDWLWKRKVKLDAVLSSVLARAEETALLTFMPGKRGLPLLVAPHVRENPDRGLSNKPQEERAQVEALLAEVGESFRESLVQVQLDYKWTQAFDRMSQGDWDNFEHFLAQSFLPDLLAARRSAKANASAVDGPIWLAVVTHSQLMRKSDIGQRCGRFWGQDQNPKKKPYNNQVLHVKYKFITTAPSRSSHDATVRYKLVAEKDCEQITPGRNAGEAPDLICMADVGETCWREIRAHAYTGHKLGDALIEQRIVSAARAVRSIQRRIDEYGTWGDVISDHALLLHSPTLEDKEFDSGQSLTAEVQEQLMLRANITLHEWGKRRCWGWGEKPDARRYMKALKDGNLSLTTEDIAVLSIIEEVTDEAWMGPKTDIELEPWPSK